MHFPLALFFIILLFVSGPVFGGWEGMGLGAMSVSLFAVSIIFLMVIVLVYKISHSNDTK